MFKNIFFFHLGNLVVMVKKPMLVYSDYDYTAAFIFFFFFISALGLAGVRLQTTWVCSLLLDSLILAIDSPFSTMLT